MNECSFYSFSRINLQKQISSVFGEEKSAKRALALYREVYKDQFYTKNYSFTSISKEMRAWFSKQFSLQNTVEIQEYFISQEDSSVKFIMKLLKDGQLVESVLIPERARLTLCISTQVGCAQACRFCQTGRMGLSRSLSCDEIVGQLIAVEQWKYENKYPENIGSMQHDVRQKVTNIVYMGMGEPLDNCENVIQSTAIFCDPQSFFLSPNKVTVSTVGLMPELENILQNTPVCVALSLHSPFEEERTRMMPVNAKHSLTNIISCLKKHLENGVRKSFLIQYTLIRGVNDSTKHAQALIELLSSYAFKINLIPLNEHEGTAYRRPDLGRVYEFQQQLKNAGLVATIRLSKGRDIAAACGQLIKNKKSQVSNNEKAQL